MDVESIKVIVGGAEFIAFASVVAYILGQLCKIFQPPPEIKFHNLKIKEME